MTKGGIHCRKKDWRSDGDIWSASVSNLLRIVPHPEKKSSLRIVVVNTYEVDATDAQQALRILGAARNLDLGQEKNDVRKKEHAIERREVGKPIKNGERKGVARDAEGHNTSSSNREATQAGRENEPKMADKNDFKIIKMLGKGSFGEVSLVRHVRTDKKYAMKVMKKTDCEELYDDLYSEKKILAMLSHPFIVGMHFWFEDSDFLYYILDYVPGGELYHHLLRRRRFPESLARFYMAEIVLALEYLHKDGIVYRDLKPENILLDADGHIKMTDFGLSKSGITSVGGGAQTFCGTPQYLAPEILRGAEHGTAVDWWSAGVVLYEMVSGSTPFQSDNRKEMYTKVVKGHISFPYFVSASCKALIRGFLVRRPQDRLGSGPLGIQEIKAQEFFASVDWDALLRKRIKAPYIPSSAQASSSAAVAGDKDVSNSSRDSEGPHSSSPLRKSTLRMRTNPRQTSVRGSMRNSQAHEISNRLESLLKSISGKDQRSSKHDQSDALDAPFGTSMLGREPKSSSSSQRRDGLSDDRGLARVGGRGSGQGSKHLGNDRDGSSSSTGSDSWLRGFKGEDRKSPSNTKIDGVLNDFFG